MPLCLLFATRAYSLYDIEDDINVGQKHHTIEDRTLAPTQLDGVFT